MTCRTVLACLSVLLPTPLLADVIAMIGTGDFAGALGPSLAEKGHTVVYGSRTPTAERSVALVERTGNGATITSPVDAAADAEIVVLAVPAEVVVSVAQSLGNLNNKVLIDPTNAFDIGDDGLAVRTTEHASIGQALQDAVPGAHVVKAFNTVWYRVIADPSLAGGPMTVPIVGDDTDAKALVGKLIEDVGFSAVDLGPIEYSRELEGMLLVWMNARMDGRPFNYLLRPERQSDN